MVINKTPLNGLKIIEPRIFQDERGWFMESYTFYKYDEAGIHAGFVQDNHAYNTWKGTLRGLHFQYPPKSQAKLVRCICGAILDVAVDLEKESPTYKKWFSLVLSAENKKQLFIPKAFAHGYITLEDNTEVVYKTDEFYSPELEGTIRYNDPEIGIDWGSIPLHLSEKDKNAPLLRELNLYF